ncbi:hypothetical protein Bca4012_009205 [Brassica carinata]
MVSESIPVDLITEILSRLPAKSISPSIGFVPYRSNGHQYPITHNSSPRRLIFAIEEEGLWSIFSSPQHHLSPASSYSLVVPSGQHADLSLRRPTVRMWLCLRFDLFLRPCLGSQADPPNLLVGPPLGLDPVGKQYKVLQLTYPYCSHDHRIMTLGTRGMRWRKIECPLRLEHLSDGLCINGVLYFLGDTSECEDMLEEKSDFVIACFDVRSEKFRFLYPESFCELINYNGRLGVVYYDDRSDDAVEFRVWVLEDVEKREWSKYAHTLRGDKLFPRYVSVVGAISTGEIVLSMADYTSGQPFYVYYFSPEGNTIRRYEIQGFGEYHEASSNPRRVHVFVDDVQDLSVKDPTLLKSSIYAPYLYNEESEESEEEEYDDGRHFRGNKKRG